MTGADRRPARTCDVLVEVFAGPQPEPEPIPGENSERRSLLRDDRRVIPDRRTGDVGHQADRLGRVRGRAEDRPGVTGVPLLGQPRLVMIRADREIKAGGFRRDHVADEAIRAGLLGHHRVAERGHRASVIAVGSGPGGRASPPPTRRPQLAIGRSGSFRGAGLSDRAVNVNSSEVVASSECPARVGPDELLARASPVAVNSRRGSCRTCRGSVRCARPHPCPGR